MFGALGGLELEVPILADHDIDCFSTLSEIEVITDPGALVRFRNLILTSQSGLCGP